tara:strand:- start:75 stop:320 length:246 start_codon:yes stop_codon:yes gene_type:complete
MKMFLILLSLCFCTLAFAKKNVKYEYKKYEKFDFGAIDIEGGGKSPGDLSISPRFRKRFRNKIPERKQFHREMKKALDAVR